MLTPLDLNGKTFSKGFRGYDTDEVNQFFSQISRDYERLYQDNVELKDSVEGVLPADGEHHAEYTGGGPGNCG